MTKYAEKVAHQADCSYPECDVQATQLLLIDRRPYWLCDRHAAMNEGVRHQDSSAR